MPVADRDALVAECVQALREPEPRLAAREVLRRALGSGALVPRDDLKVGINVLHHAPDLTVLEVVWPPLMSLWPHDHRMWAAIAVYGGREDNAFFRRERGGIVAAGGRTLEEGDVLLLGDDAVHAVHNPLRAYTGAIHVYGGDFINEPRSQWDPQTLAEQAFDLAALHAEFARAEAAFRADPG